MTGGRQNICVTPIISILKSTIQRLERGEEDYISRGKYKE